MRAATACLVLLLAVAVAGQIVTTTDAGTSTTATATTTGGTTTTDAGTTTGAGTTTAAPTPKPAGPTGPPAPPAKTEYTNGQKFGISTATFASIAFVWCAVCAAMSQYAKRNPIKEGPPEITFDTAGF